MAAKYTESNSKLELGKFLREDDTISSRGKIQENSCLSSLKNDRYAQRKYKHRATKLPQITNENRKPVGGMCIFKPTKTARKGSMIRYQISQKTRGYSDKHIPKENRSTVVNTVSSIKEQLRDRPTPKTGGYSAEHIPIENRSTVVNTVSSIKQQQHTNSKDVQANKASYIKLRNMSDKDIIYTDILHKESVENTSCGSHCVGSLVSTLSNDGHREQFRDKEEIIQQAKDFMEQYFKSEKSNGSSEHIKRWNEIVTSIKCTGTYSLTYDELVFGTKLAWRNAPRCIGRIQWSNLQVFDARKVKSAIGMFKAICRHIEYATNKGNIRSTVTVFHQRTDGKHDFQVWNSQLIMYAGYKQSDGTIIGDPATVEFTSFCMEMGWKGRYGMFDVLPLVLQANGGDPEWFEIPPELVLEVVITHPRFPGFAELGLKWYCIPAVANMKFDCGGLEFTGCPFSGWYMNTEIASRDLCDKHRYNLLEKIARVLGIDTKNNASLWKDRTAVETNIAVLHSFQSLGVTIVDHHTASESFMTFLHNEHRQRGGCPADWVWIVPPLSGSLTSVFHQELALFKLKPSFEYQNEVWRNYAWQRDKTKSSQTSSRSIHFKAAARAVVFCSVLMNKYLSQRVRCTILYATETGKSEKFASTLNEIFKHNFNSRVSSMDKYIFDELRQESLLLFVTSTFGNGDPPENGKNFANNMMSVKDLQLKKSGITKAIKTLDKEGVIRKQNGHTSNDLLHHIRFAVFGLGSRAYSNFCAFGHQIDNTMGKLGAVKIQNIGEGDELCGQEESFLTWAKQVFQAACRRFNVGNKNSLQDASDILARNDMTWLPGKFQLVPVPSTERLPLCTGLSKVYNRSIYLCSLKEKSQLEMRKSSRQTILVKIDLGDNRDQINYSPGDHLLLYPKNPESLVQDIVKTLRDIPPLHQLVKIECTENYAKSVDKNGKHSVLSHLDRFPPSTLEDLLTNFIDITAPPTQEFLNKLSSQATKEEEKIKIQHLANNKDAYDEWKRMAVPNIGDVLNCFPSLNICPTFLITQLPILQPRYYSISSSAEASPEEIDVTVKVLQYRTGNGTKRKGVCSNWLNSLGLGDEINCAIRIAPLFHLPKDLTVPIIMVGTGTGIAPFRSFWLQRKIDKTRQLVPHSGQRSGWGDMYLYFGCRHAIIDNIYYNELEKLEKERVLTNCYFAYSREPSLKKTYVQDLLRKKGQDVYKKIVTENGHIYICGNIQMAADVKTVIQTEIQIWGKMSAIEAQHYIKKLKEENRLHEDIFGFEMKSPRKVKGTPKSKK